MKTLNDYMSMSYRMEVVEDKDRRRIRSFVSGSPWLHYLRRNSGKCSFKCAGCKKSMA